MDIKKIWEEEKPIIKKCVQHIKYDEILINSLENLLYEIDDSLLRDFDSSDSITQILSTLENQRYKIDVLRNATNDELLLVEDLKKSLYLLETTIKYSGKRDKETTYKENTYKLGKSNKIPNTIDSVDKYKNLWKPVEDNRDLTKYKKLNKINL